jgi:outer membrane protein
MVLLLAVISSVFCGYAFGGSSLLLQNDPNLSGSSKYFVKPSGLQAGAGVVVIQRPYKGIDPKVIGIPFIMYEGKDWSFRGTRFDYKLAKDGPWTVKGLLRLRMEGYDEDDSSALKGMDDRDITLDAGLCFAYSKRWGTVSIDAVTDTLGENKGQEISLSYSKPMVKPFGFKKLFMAPFAGVEWRTSSLNNYYYGVRPGEATAQRPAYNAGDDANIFIGLTGNYQMNEQWSIFGLFKNQWIGDEIRESPIVNKGYVITVVSGLIYSF